MLSPLEGHGKSEDGGKEKLWLNYPICDISDLIRVFPVGWGWGGGQGREGQKALL